MVDYIDFALKPIPRIAIDTESFDPGLKKLGPGVRREGRLVGVSIAWSGFSEYFAFGHDEGNNCRQSQVMDWLRYNLSRYMGEVCFANALYDLDYLSAHHNVKLRPEAKIRDILVAEPVIDENQFSYNLDRLANKYLGHGKNEDLLIDLYGKNFKEFMHKIPGDLVRDYAIDDAIDTLEIYNRQEPIIDAEGLRDVFEMESDLIPMLLWMRQLGVRVDLQRAEEVSNQFFLEEKRLLRLLEAETGVKFYSDANTSVWKATALAEAFDNLNIEYPLTPKTQKPSFTRSWLEGQADFLDVAKWIVEARQYDKFRSAFLENGILGNHVGDRIHCEFHQAKSDLGGTVTGRFSCSHPNLQQIPSRGDLAKIVRSLFIPEEGHLWGRYDYSQIEYRILVHFAYAFRLQGSTAVIKAYQKNPWTDYHTFVQNLVEEILGLQVDRKKIKNVNFGLIYGMGTGKLARTLAMTEEDANFFIRVYNQAIPFAGELREAASKLANRRGFIKTILGRKRRFDRWESRDFLKAKEDGTFTFEEAETKYVRIKRAGVYRALNAAIQGSAAEIMKKAMLEIWKSGICDILPIHLTVHDELDMSVPETRDGKAAFMEVGHIMEDCVSLHVPILVDADLVSNWGEAL